MNIRVNLGTPISDGTEVVFRSPVDCSQVTGLRVIHDGGSKVFAFADAHGNNVGDIDHLFAENVAVKVILDVTNAMAFVQNADTNAYIERTFIKSVNGVTPDENGNVEVQCGIEAETDPTVPEWAKQANKPTYTADEVGALPSSTVIPTVPTKVSAFENDKGYLTEHQSLDGYAKTSDIPTKPEDIGAQPSGNYALKTEIPNVPVQSVNGKTGAVTLSASDVNARSSLWLPTYTEIGAEKSGTASSVVSTHNTETKAHNDIRLLVADLAERLDALADSDDETLDQMAEVVAYIKANRDLIDQITTGKVSVSDIVDNLTTNVTNKPLSAAQGVALKALIDAITVPTKLSQLTDDSTHRTVTDTEKSVWNAKSTFSGNYADLSGKPTIPTVPTNVSAFINDAGYLQSYTETDPTVPSWAKASTKPSYNKTEVGLGNVDNVKQYSANNPPVVAQASAPTDTSVVWVDTEDNTLDAFQDAVDNALAQAKASGEFDGVDGKSYLSEFVTVKDYGATGDGKTDDTKAINDALEDAGKSGRQVYFPAGTYIVKSSLKVPNGILLRGDCGKSVIKTSVTSGYVLQSPSSTTLASNSIVDLTFQNNNPQNQTAGNGLQAGDFIYEATGLYMRNCRVKNYARVFFSFSNNSYLYNNRFSAIYEYFAYMSTDSVVDGNYINSSQYGLSNKQSKVYARQFNSTSFQNNLVDYFYDVFAVKYLESGTISNNTFNRCVTIFHDTLQHLSVCNNVFTKLRASEVDDLTGPLITDAQKTALKAEKWGVIKFDNLAVSEANHIIAEVTFANNMGYNVENYIYIADGVQVVVAETEFRGNQINTGVSNKPSAVDVGFRNASATESAYNSFQNVYLDFLDMKEWTTLPSASLTGNTAKSVKSFPYMKAIYNNEIYINMNGTWRMYSPPMYDGGVS